LPSANAPIDLLLEVVVNGRSIGKIGDFTDIGGSIHVARQEWSDLGFKAGASLAEQSGTSSDIELRTLRGLSYRVDMPTQKIYITTKIDLLTTTLIGRASNNQDASHVKPQSGTGFVVDYDLNTTHGSGYTLYGGAVDGRIYSPYGVLSTSGLAYNQGLPHAFVRLDTAYTFSQPGSLRRFVAGDFINGGLNWSRPVRLGGLQFTSDFGLRPDLITFPVPSMAGQVAVPSTVDVLVNGTRQFSNAVQPGPFEVTQAPVITGAGTVSVAVQDASGTTRTLTSQSFYASNQMLRAGLASYSVEIGKVRQSYGFLSDDYRQIAGSASGRYGLKDWLTLEGHGEATAQFGMAGGGASVNLFQRGVLSLDLAGSLNGGRKGGLASIGIERITPRYSLVVSTQWSNPDFMDIATTQGQPQARRTVRASAGFNGQRWGTFGLAYTDTKQYFYQGQTGSQFGAGVIPGTGYFSTVPGGGLPLTEAHISLVSFTYSQTLPWNMSVFATGFIDLHNKQDRGAILGLSIPFGMRTTISPEAGINNTSPYGVIQASRSIISNGDVGFQSYVSTDAPSRQMGQVYYRSPYATVNAGVDRIGGEMNYRGGARGSLVMTDGSVFAANFIQDSFAVVDTGGASHVHVLQENRDVGRTDSNGLLLVPDLRSYNVNHISIDPKDLPLDAQVGATSTLVEPRDRSGVVVKLRGKVGRSAILHIVDAKGKPLPVGSFVRHEGEPTQPIGYDGETFLQALDRHNTIIVTSPDARTCVLNFPFVPKKGQLVEIPDLTCNLQ